MKTTVFLLTFMILNGFFSKIFGQVAESQFDQILFEQEYENSPGFAVLVAKKGEVLYRKAAGFANLEHNIQLQPDHIFRIASITKQFTACAILKLEEEGKLSLQDDVAKFIEDYPTQGYKITIEHLLTHTSGITNYTSKKEWDTEMSKKDLSPSEMIDFIKNDSLDFAPAEKYEYNNSAYVMLGYIIEAVSGKTYEEYLRETFFIPLGMENTSYGSTSKIVKNRVSGYHNKDNKFENADYVSLTQPHAAGALLSNVDDLFKWYSAVMSDKVINKKNRLRAHSSFTLNNGKPTGYGYGWHLGNIRGVSMIHHGGGINGFSTYSLYLPAEEVFVAVFSNCDGMSSKKKAFKFAAAAINQLFDWQEIQVKKDVLKEYEAVYESDEEAMRTVIVESDQLMYVHPSGSRLRLIPFQRDSFFVENSFTVYAFERDSKGDIISMTASGTGYSPDVYSKTEKTIDVKREIKLPENICDQYIGQYELMPDFIITISKKDDTMFAKTSKQPNFEITPYRENKFFSKEFPLEFVFHRDESGNVNKVIIIQGKEYEARRMN